MQETEIALLEGVKQTVAKFGLSEFSTRKLAEVSGINGGLIYHYFENKTQLLYKAYEIESDEINKALIYYINEVSSLSVTFEEKCELCFRRFWRELLSDTARLLFCSSYYHSAYFNNTAPVHQKQLNALTDRLEKLYPDRENCVSSLYAVMSVLYDAAYRVATGALEENKKTEQNIFSVCYPLICAEKA